ncbi:MAG TPA: hypothetical protein VFK27_02555 [Bacillales bacterium]|nr:hypothetical protein [Bacillales bacterium]
MNFTSREDIKIMEEKAKKEQKEAKKAAKVVDEANNNVMNKNK